MRDENKIFFVNGDSPAMMAAYQKAQDTFKYFWRELSGYTLLHKESIAGNRTFIEELLAAGADTSLKTENGKTALDYAKAMNWEHIIPLLEK